MIDVACSGSGQVLFSAGADRMVRGAAGGGKRQVSVHGAAARTLLAWAFRRLVTEC